MSVEDKTLEIAADLTGGDNTRLQALALVSIAISMKRIADSFCSNPEKFGLVDSIFEVAERLKGS